MMYIRTSKRSGSKNTRVIAMIGGGIVVLVAIVQYFTPHFLPSIFTTIVRPFWRIEFSVSSGSLNSPESLLAENESLKRDIQALQIQNSSTAQIQMQNNDLLRLLGRSDANMSIVTTDVTISGSSSTPSAVSNTTIKPFSNTILGAVLVRPPVAPFDELVVDVGEDQGIVSGAKVFAPGNILIGTVADVLGQTSKVKLFSSPGESYPVLIGSGHLPATATGRGGGQYEAQIPQATKVAVGDMVVDNSVSSKIFGNIRAVLNNPADPFETVLFAPPVNVYELRWVFVSTTTTNFSNQNNSIAKPNQQATTTIHATTTPKAIAPKTKK